MSYKKKGLAPEPAGQPPKGAELVTLSRRIIHGKIEPARKTEEIKNALAIILADASLLLGEEERLSQEDKKKLEQIKGQVWRINGLLKEN